MKWTPRVMRGTGLIVLGLAVGLTAALFWNRDSGPKEQILAPVNGSPTEQIEALRADIDQQLVAMQQQLSELGRTVETISERLALDEAQPREVPTAVSNTGFAEVIDALESSSLSQDARRRRIAEAGFTQDRIDWLDRRVEELSIEARQAQTEAAASGEPIDSDRLAALALEPASLLRPEIGDAEYERYLQAKGWPTTVGVSHVLASSPAEQGGLREGDEIVAYGGQRVFSSRELNSLAAKRSPGESVSVEVLRDGQNMQFIVPGGFIGIEDRGILRINRR